MNRMKRWAQAHRTELALATAAVVIIAMLIDWAYAEGAASMAFALVAGTEGGEHVVNGPVTTDVVHQSSSDYLLSEIDKQVTRIRPMATPVDQLSRLAGSKRSGSMVVDYYNVDTKPTSTTLKTAISGPSGGFADESNQRVSLSTNNDAIFDVSDTILVQGVKGYEGTRESKFDLVLYVVSKSEDGKLSAMAVNGQTVGDMENCIPTIAKDTVLIRMGRAATELDVQTPQFEALPQRASQYCQIFKAQVEQSVLHKMANKEIGWTLNDQGEAAEESK